MPEVVKCAVCARNAGRVVPLPARVPGGSCDLEKMGSFSRVILVSSHSDDIKGGLDSLNIGNPFYRQE